MVALEGEDLDAKEPFMFVFRDMEDMEVFPSESSDQQDCLYELPHSLVAGRWP